MANIFTGPIMEKNHTSARNAKKLSCRRWFLWGDTPHTPPGRGASVKWVSIFEWTHTGEKPYNTRDARKSYVTETPQKWRFFRCSKRKKSFVANILTGPIMEKNHTSTRNATKTSVAETSQQWSF